MSVPVPVYTHGNPCHRPPTVSVIMLALALLLPGCTSVQVEEAANAPQSVTLSLEDLAASEYWTRLEFNGERIGFTHLAIRSTGDPDRYELRSEAVMHFSLLGVEKTTVAVTTDWVDADLHLQRFQYSYEIDGRPLTVSGRVAGDLLEARVNDDGVFSTRNLPLEQAVYPSVVTALYAALHGLAIDSRYAYLVYEGQSQRTAHVTQHVAGFERSASFEGDAFRVNTMLYGQEINTWISALGEPLMEQSMKGIFGAALEDQHAARRALLLAALDKDKSLLGFARVKSAVSIDDARAVERMKVELDGLTELAIPSDNLQRCEQRGGAVSCRILASAGAGRWGESASDLARYLQGSEAVPGDDPRVVELATTIAAANDTRTGRIEASIAWIAAHIETQAGEPVPMADVIDRGRASTLEQARLYTALARALGIPTRIAAGLVYSSEEHAFTYHAWAESWLGDRWWRVDPARVQDDADATHIKFLSGDTVDELLPMTTLMGRLRVAIGEVNLLGGP